MKLKGLLTSLQNPRVKGAVRLRERRERERTKAYLVEGYRELLRAASGGAPLLTLFVSPTHFLGENETDLIEKVSCDVFEVSPNVFEKMSYRDRPDGLLAIAKKEEKTLEELTLSKNPFLLVAEGIEKPGNLGTILRSADGAGVDALLVCDRCTDITNPNVVRASVGTFFTVPNFEVTSEKLIPYLKENKITIVAATPSAKMCYTDANLSGPIAIAVGTEQLGLSDKWMDAASLHVSIPMRGAADSLNVATATTLLLYEAARQRY
ncbi:MAG: RNA methyltransferase [Chlamydiia bacterium]|nr:RNA methyltransferase [Chlamydiia bacterium]